MAHSFDTGLAKAQRTLIRDAIVAKLAPLKQPTKYLACVEELPRTYRGEGDDDGKGMLVEIMRGRVPCAGVALGAWRRTKNNHDPLEMIGELAVSVYVASSHARIVDGRLAGDAVSALDDRKDPGLDTMLEHVIELLNGQGLGVTGTKELVVTDEDEAATFADVSIWELKFTLEVERITNPNRNGTDVVMSIEGRHEEDGTADVDGDIDIAPLVTVANLAPETP